MVTFELIRQAVKNNATQSEDKAKRFFKTGDGSYAQNDRFIGITVPALRKLAKEFAQSELSIVQQLLESEINEERLLSLFILVNHYKKSDETDKERIFNFYLNTLDRINNWNLIDSSAHLIVGAHLWNKDRCILEKLAQSEQWWHRRIAVVATWYFIKKNDLNWTFRIAKIVVTDQHDLMQKAVGWMLREAGKKNHDALVQFLNEHAALMPRTMVRYAIEKFPEQQRKHFLLIKKNH